jgi:acetyl-CoA synthetase
LNEADEVSESAVIGFPHELKGEGIGCFVVLKDSVQPSEELTKYASYVNCRGLFY